MKQLILGLGVSLMAATAAGADLSFKWTAADLTTADRVAATHARIEQSAADYCEANLRDTRAISRMRSCMSWLTRELVDQIDDVRLTAYAETGRVDEALLARR